MAIDDALRLLAEVAVCAEGLLPSVARDHRNEPLARNVIGVFKEYELRLRELDLPSDMRGLANSERDVVRQIVKRARTALHVLEQGGDDLSLALDRAYVSRWAQGPSSAGQPSYRFRRPRRTRQVCRPGG